jgi:acyl-CoA synthetase (NDP forming)
VSPTSSTTVLGCFLAAEGIPPLLAGDAPDTGVPVFATPEPAALALGRAAAHAQWRSRAPGTLPQLPGLDLEAAREIVRSSLDRSPDGGWLTPGAVSALLHAAGIAAPRSIEVADADEAARAAAELAVPVAVKASGADLVHKSDVGGVRLGITTMDGAARAYREMADRIGDHMTGAIVQPMAAPGIEMIAGVVLDQLFGPLIMFGLGGTSAELFEDRAFRILPLTDVDAAELVRSLRSSPLLLGYRGADPVAVGAVEDVLQRVARLAAMLPELAELEINPLIVTPEGVMAVDARARVAAAPTGPPEDLRRLSATAGR